MKFYLHTDKDDARQQLKDQGLSLETIDINNLQYTGYEVEFDIVLIDGNIYATHVQGERLDQMAKI